MEGRTFSSENLYAETVEVEVMNRQGYVDAEKVTYGDGSKEKPGREEYEC
jgi:hypothetical protein